MQFLNRLLKPKETTDKERIAKVMRKIKTTSQLQYIATLVGEPEGQDWDAIQSELSPHWLELFSTTVTKLENEYSRGLQDAYQDHRRAVSDILAWRNGEKPSDELDELVKAKLTSVEQDKVQAIAQLRYDHAETLVTAQDIFINMMNEYKERQNGK